MRILSLIFVIYKRQRRFNAYVKSRGAIEGRDKITNEEARFLDFQSG